MTTPSPLHLVMDILITLVDSWYQKIPEKGKWHDTKQGHLDSKISRNTVLLVGPQICCTTVFAATNSTGLSDLLSARGLAHSHRNTDPFVVSFGAQGLAHCGCQLPHASPHVARCCFLSVGIHICSPAHNSIQFPFQLVGGICFFVNEGIQYTVTK